MTQLLILLFVIIVIASVVKFFRDNPLLEESEKPSYLYKRQKYFMSLTENRCYQALIDAVGDKYYIFAQVHLPTIVDEKIKGQIWKAAFRHISQKSVDFVLCDKTNISPILAIELDDRTHNRVDRIERDDEVERILRAAGLPLLRIENHGHFNPQTLSEMIKEKLPA